MLETQQSALTNMVDTLPRCTAHVISWMHARSAPKQSEVCTAGLLSTAVMHAGVAQDKGSCLSQQANSCWHLLVEEHAHARAVASSAGADTVPPQVGLRHNQTARKVCRRFDQ